VPVDGRDGRGQAELSAPSAELFGRVLAEVRGCFGEDHRGEVDEHPALRHVAELRAMT
jgi:hypothetical protein